MKTSKASNRNLVAGSMVHPASSSSPAVNQPVSESFSLSPRWEVWGVIATLALGTLIQLNAVFHHGIMGQDFLYNLGFVLRCAKDLSAPFTFEGTNPPFSIMAYAFIIRWTQGIHFVECIGLLNIVVNLLGMGLVYAIVRRLVRRPLLRLSTMVLVTFLPVRLIHSVVLSADAWTVLPFFAILWLIDQLSRTTEFRAQLRWALALCGLLFISVFIKYTYFSTIAACAGLLIQMGRRNQWAWHKGAMLVVLVTAIPALTGYMEVKLNGKFSGQWGIQSQMLNVMSPRTVLFFRPADAHILDAPPYNEPLYDRTALHSTQIFKGFPIEISDYELLYPNRYSYPALLHLGIFTDVLNVFQYDPTDSYIGTRSAINQSRMALAVKLAVPWSVVCFFAVLFSAILYLLKGLVKPQAYSARLEALLALSLAWLLNIIVFLPFIMIAYSAGAWLPRLIVPVVLGFIIILFHVLDQVLDRWKLPGVPSLVLTYALIQSALHISFLWPWGNYLPLALN